MLHVACAVISSPTPRTLGTFGLADFAWVPGAVLITRLRPDKRHAGLWELPGGKLEPGESGAECLVRELSEELGIVVVAGPYITTNVHDYGRGPIALQAWHVTWTAGELAPTDHDRLAWVPRDRLLEFAWVAGDVPLVQALIA